MKLGKREKILTAGVGFFLVLLLIQKSIILPFSDRLEAMTVQIKASEEKMARLLYLDSQRENTASVFKKLKPYIEIGKTKEDTESVMMKKIEEMAKGCNITLLNMKPEGSGSRRKTIHMTQKVALAIEGSQQNIIQFLYKLENSNYPLRVNKLDFKVKSRDMGLMTADLDVYFIYFL